MALSLHHRPSVRSDHSHASTCSSPITPERPNRRNVLIVGDVGVGKSSLVNLIAGAPMATISSGAKSCTLHSEEHLVTFGGAEFALHDTAGLHEAHGKMKPADYLDAIQQAYALISKLEQSGGINLLVFCMKGGRISRTTQETYNLFIHVLCNRRVPVVIAVTHLEQYDNMEAWWEENKEVIDEYELRSDGHACITATRGFRNAFDDKYEESRGVILQQLLHYSKFTWKEEKTTWVRRVLLHMRTLLCPRAKPLAGSALKRKLIKDCGFSPNDAKHLVNMMEHTPVVVESDHKSEEKSCFEEKFESESAHNTSYISLPVVPYTANVA